MNRVGEMVDGRMRIERFDGRKFGFQKIKIEEYLYQKYLYLPLGEKSKSKPTGIDDANCELLDKKAFGVVRLCVSASVDFNIVEEKTIKVVLDKLTKIYERISATNKAYLIKKYYLICKWYKEDQLLNMQIYLIQLQINCN